METLLLVRHAFAGSNRDGNASCAVPGEGLTPDGIEQARALARTVSAEEIAVAVTSRLARTQETLALALDGRDVPVVVVPELDEIDFGAFAEGPLDTYRAWAGAQPPDRRAPGGGESRADAAARFARGLRVVLARDEATVLLVGHALPHRKHLDAADGLPPAALMKPLEHTIPNRHQRAAVERAAALLEDWSRAPQFRDPSNEGRLG